MERALCFALLINLNLIISRGIRVAASSCSTSVSFNGSAYTFANCVSLGAQDAYLAWTLGPDPEIPSTHSVLRAAFSGTALSSSGWVGWGLNPDSPQMVGSSVFVAYTAPNGSTLLPYKLTPATLSGTPLACSPIDYVVTASAVELFGDGAVTMLVVLRLAGNTSAHLKLNHVWNRGSSVDDFQPGPHSLQANDLKAVAQIDMSSAAASWSNKQALMRNRHGVLNAVGWGLLLPAGVVSARYLRPFSAGAVWFYVHVSIQCTGYAMGVSGWITGLRMHRHSPGPGPGAGKHSTIATLLFALSTLQVMALLLRPNKKHKLRLLWNIYHHSVGYAVVALGIFNVFVGFAILLPPQIWHHAFTCAVAALAGLAFSFEILTWWLLFFSKLQRGAPPTPPQKRGATGTFGPTDHVLRVL